MRLILFKENLYKNWFTQNPPVGSQASVPPFRTLCLENWWTVTQVSVRLLKFPQFTHSCHKYLLHPYCVPGKLQALGIEH